MRKVEEQHFHAEQNFRLWINAKFDQLSNKLTNLKSF